MTFELFDLGGARDNRAQMFHDRVFVSNASVLCHFTVSEDVRRILNQRLDRLEKRGDDW